MPKKKKTETFGVKKDLRRQAKKRKLEAFLDLVRKDDLKPDSEKKKVGNSFQENYLALKDELKKYRNKKVLYPSFSLKDYGRCAFVNLSSKDKISKSGSPLFVEDIYHLILASTLGNLSPFPPRWITLEYPQLISKTVLLEIEGLTEHDVIEVYSNLNKDDPNQFPFAVEIISSEIPIATELSTLHLTTGMCSLGKKKYSSIFPVNEASQSEKAKQESENKITKLHLLLSPIQLAMENYPLPQSVFEQSKSDGYKFSKDSYSPVHENSPMFALDCEMCRTVTGKQEVTRIAIVNEDLETIYHTLVKPKEKIVDYITRFSGITEEMLKDITTTLNDVHRDISKILPSDAILCGQSLNFDLHALRLIHPYVIDTSIIFNEYGVRSKKTSLKKLSQFYLKESIQGGKRGHNPIEDSIATMKLVQLKLENSVEYGDSVLCPDAAQNSESSADTLVSISEIGDISELIKLNPDCKTKSIFSRLEKFSKTACLVGSEKSLNNYCKEMITENVRKMDKSKFKKIFKASSDNVEHYDVIMSHLSLNEENCPLTELIDDIKQMLSTLPSKTFFIILLSGIKKQADEKFIRNFCMINIKT